MSVARVHRPRAVFSACPGCSSIVRVVAPSAISHTKAHTNPSTARRRPCSTSSTHRPFPSPLRPSKRTIVPTHHTTARRLFSSTPSRSLSKLVDKRRYIRQLLSDMSEARIFEGVTKQSTILSELQKMQFTGDIDFGILPGTLIMPDFQQRPNPFRHPLARSHMELQRLWQRIREVASMYVFHFRANKPRPPLALFSTAGIAKRLYEEMHTLHAEGDLEKLKNVCATGLQQDLEKHIYTRPMVAPRSAENPGTTPRPLRYRWTLHRYVGRPRVLSQRMAMMPNVGGQQFFLRQAVVRIKSEQSLVPADTGFDGVEAVRATVREDVVVQRAYFAPVDGPFVPKDWVVWGTTQSKAPASKRGFDAFVGRIKKGERERKEALSDISGAR